MVHRRCLPAPRCFISTAGPRTAGRFEATTGFVKYRESESNKTNNWCPVTKHSIAQQSQSGGKSWCRYSNYVALTYKVTSGRRVPMLLHLCCFQKIINTLPQPGTHVSQSVAGQSLRQVSFLSQLRNKSFFPEKQLCPGVGWG